MRKLRDFSLLFVAAVIVAGLLCAPSAYSQYAPSNARLQGVVKSSDGNPMEGVVISTREDGKTFTTSVFSDAQGMYSFPRLEPGKFKVWAQAVGFDAAKSDLDLKDNQTEKLNLELKPLQDFHRQLSASEWINSIPDADHNDARMKALLVRNCTGCHQIGFLLQNRFDVAGWGTMIKLMESFSALGYPDTTYPPNEMMITYKDELAGYLAKIRGPESVPFVPKAFPRPTGDATKVIITEFDLPRNDISKSIMSHNGSDWMEGIPSKYAFRASHDITVDRNGHVFFSDDSVPGRTIGMVDPKTGKVTAFDLKDKDGHSVATHGIYADVNGNVWATNQTENTLLMFDQKTGQFKRFPKPEGFDKIGGTTAAADSHGNPWVDGKDGAVKLDAETGKYIYYAAPHPGVTYGMTVDSEDQGWFTEPGIETVCVVDKTGKVSEVVLPALKTDLANDKDRQVTASTRLTQNNATPLQKIPRRIAADLGGNYVWVTEYGADQIARIDIHTKEVKEYPLPHKFSQPYGINVDKDHNVWVDELDQDRIDKFDPKTEKFTTYMFPTRGTEIRSNSADNTTEPPTIWVPYNRTNKVARIQFRTSTTD